MPHQVIPLDPATRYAYLELIVDVTPAMRRAQGNSGGAGAAAPPGGRVCRALIDTGATQSAVDAALLAHLGIPPTGTALLLTPSTAGKPVAVRLFDVSIILVHLDKARETYLLDSPIPVTESVLSPQGFDVLLGCDVLKDCLLVYDGKAKTCSIAF